MNFFFFSFVFFFPCAVKMMRAISDAHPLIKVPIPKSVDGLSGTASRESSETDRTWIYAVDPSTTPFSLGEAVWALLQVPASLPTARSCLASTPRGLLITY